MPVIAHDSCHAVCLAEAYVWLKVVQEVGSDLLFCDLCSLGLLLLLMMCVSAESLSATQGKLRTEMQSAQFTCAGGVLRALRIPPKLLANSAQSQLDRLPRLRPPRVRDFYSAIAEQLHIYTVTEGLLTNGLSFLPSFLAR